MITELLVVLTVSLILTLAIEIGFFLLIGKRNKNDLLLTGLVNIITNPAVVLLFWLMALYTDLNHVMIKAVLELLAILIEGYYYKKYGRNFKYPYLFSIAANVFSFGIGEVIQQLF